MSSILVKIVFWTVLLAGGLLALWVLGALLIMLLLGCYAGVFNLVREIRVRRRMRLAGRWLTKMQLMDRIENSPGTLLLESPTVGWRVSRAWWTPDDVLAAAPAAPPDMSKPNIQQLSQDRFINWCHASYTDLDRGLAYLVAVYNGHRHVKRLLARYPGAKKVEVWSGVIGLTIATA